MEEPVSPAVDPRLPMRRGPRPRTSRPNPHGQLEQHPGDPTLRERLAELLFGLEGVTEGPSGISVPGARAAVLDPSLAGGPADAFMVRLEFAHLHPLPDSSLHAMLPTSWAQASEAAGWAEPHPAAEFGLAPPTAVMLYAPRDTDELAVVEGLLRVSYWHARGQAAAPDSLGFE